MEQGLDLVWTRSSSPRRGPSRGLSLVQSRSRRSFESAACPMYGRRLKGDRGVRAYAPSLPTGLHSPRRNCHGRTAVVDHALELLNGRCVYAGQSSPKKGQRFACLICETC